jgi:hypothetical protein
VPHEQRPLPRDAVQLGDVRERTAVLGLTETCGEKPALAVAPGAGNGAAEKLIQLFQAAGTGHVQFRQAQAEPGGVAMRIDEAWSDGGTAKVQYLKGVEPIQIVVEAHDASLPDAQRTGHRTGRIHGDDLCVPQEEVEFHGWF